MQLKNSTLRIFISLLLLICPIVFYAQKHNYDDKIYKTQNGGMVDNPNGVFTVSPMGQEAFVLSCLYVIAALLGKVHLAMEWISMVCL